MNSNKTKKIVLGSVLAAFCCVATFVIKIPTPLKGYINLGDSVVLLTGFMLSPLYGFLAAGIGSALADIISGYVIYAPATFIIKGAMALIAYYCFKGMQNKIGNTASKLIGGLIAEILMILGYYVFGGFLYGFVPSALDIPANAIQGAVGLVVGLILAKIFDSRFKWK